MSTWRKVGCCLIAAVAGLGARAEEAATPRISAASYVRRGIVLQLDAIDNVGFSQHDSHAGVWKDLSGNENDLAVADYFDSQLDSWTDSSLKAKKVDGISFKNSCTGYSTLEICAKATKNGVNEYLFNAGDGRMAAFRPNGIGFYREDAAYTLADFTRAQAAAVHEPTAMHPVVYTNGFRAAAAAGEATHYTTGINPATCLGRNQGSTFVTGEYCALRIYSSALSEEELRYNAVLDGVRYFGESLPDEWRVNESDGRVEFKVTVSVAGGSGAVSVNGVPGNEAWVRAFEPVTIRYALAEGEVVAEGIDFPSDVTISGNELSFSATRPCAVTVRISSLARSLVLEPISQQVYTGEPVVPEVVVKTATGVTLEKGRDFTLACADNTAVGTATVRVNGINGYQGESTGGAFAIQLPVSAYARRGIIAHWDAIDNVGTGVHDPDAGVWKDLTGGENDIVISNFVGTGEQLAGWTADSLRANGVTQIPMSKTCKDYTSIEVCADYPGNVDQVLFNSGDGFNKCAAVKYCGVVFYQGCYLYTLSSQSYLQAAAVHYPNAADPVVYAYGNSAVSSGTRQSAGKNSSASCLGRGANSSAFAGAYRALRLYDVPLTAEEIALNAAVDEVRFHGGLLNAPDGWRWSASDGASLARIRVETGDGRGTLTVNGIETNEAWVVAGTPMTIAYQLASGEFIEEIENLPDSAVVDGGTVTFDAIAPVTLVLSIGSMARSFRVAAIPTQTYTGSAVKPEVVVETVAGDPLERGVDFEVTYAHNVEIGMADVHVSGLRDYEGVSSDLRFAVQLPVSAYARRGIIAHWDGFDNVGTGQHDSEAGYWKDLTGNGHSFAVSNHLGAAKQLAGWTDSTLQASGLGVYSIAADSDCADYVSLEAAAKCGNTTEQVLFNGGGFGKVVAVKSGIFGCYVNGKAYPQTDPGWLQVAAVHAPTVSDPQVYTNGVGLTNSVGTLLYSSGGGAHTSLGRGSEYTKFMGEYCAIRLYRRALSEPEIALNAALDRVRFNGGTPELPDGWRWDPSTGRMLSRVTVGISKGSGIGVINGVKTNEMWFAEGTPVEVSFFSPDTRDHVEGVTCSLPDCEIDGKKVRFTSGAATSVSYDIRIGPGLALIIR